MTRKRCYLQRQGPYNAKRGGPQCRGVLGHCEQALLTRVARPSWPRGAGPVGCATGLTPPPLDSSAEALAVGGAEGLLDLHRARP